MDLRVGLWRKRSAEELMLLNCGIGENSLRVPWTARRSNQSILKKSVLNIHWKDGCWSWNSNTLATWCEELTHWKRPCCWERLKAGGEGDDRGWDGWMASPIRWTWVWVSSRSWWQGILACYSPWGNKESDSTERLNWTESHSVHFIWGGPICDMI